MIFRNKFRIQTQKRLAFAKFCRCLWVNPSNRHHLTSFFCSGKGKGCKHHFRMANAKLRTWEEWLKRMAANTKSHTAFLTKNKFNSLNSQFESPDPIKVWWEHFAAGCKVTASLFFLRVPRKKNARMISNGMYWFLFLKRHAIGLEVLLSSFNSRSKQQANHFCSHEVCKTQQKKYELSWTCVNDFNQVLVHLFFFFHLRETKT